jgi:ABC-type antimicrobial peptide transport system permease subunit
VVVNEAFAEKFNLGRNPVGKRMTVGSAGPFDLEIVGLVQNAKYNEVKGEVPPVFFRPYRQQPQVASLNFYVKSAAGLDAALASIRPVIERLDPNLPIEDLRTMPQQIEQSVFQDRIVSTLSAAFAALATVLASVGLYGVLAYTVSQRTREFGLRMALGAEPRRLRGLVMRRVGWMTLVGGALGLAAAVAIGRTVQSELYAMEGVDLSVLSTAAAILILVSLAAGFIPAYRASRVDPMTALRYE